MEKAVLIHILTEEEIKKYLDHEIHLYSGYIELLSLKQILKIGLSILPLIYPNTITDGSSIIGKTFEFLAKRAAKKGLTIF